MRGLRLLLVLSLAACGEAQAPKSAVYGPAGELDPRPENLRGDNVLFISIDTLRADHLGCYGYSVATSPVIDALAKAGALFEHATSSSPWTTPSHVSMMTSLYPQAHGVYAYPEPGQLDSKTVTLAEILRANGWRTAGFTEGGYAKGDTGLADGFDVFPSWPNDGAGFVSHELEPSRLVENAERALEWLDEFGGSDAAEPFFLFFHTYEPHYEYRPPAEHLNRISSKIDLASERAALGAAIQDWNRGNELTAAQKGLLIRHRLQGDLRTTNPKRPQQLLAMLGRFFTSEWRSTPNFRDDIAYLTTLYDAEIRFTDDVVGRILSKLETLGVLDQTLIVLTSDHGEGLMDHEEMQHGFHLYDEILAIPLIIRFPGRVHAGARHANQVRSIDILPTVLEWLGLPQPEQAQGESLLSLLRNGGAPRLSFAEGLTVEGRERDLGMVHDGRWKFLRNARSGAEALFDLASDPDELIDVAQAATPSELNRLRTALDRISEENGRRAANYRVTPNPMTEQERLRLKALGYLVDDRESEQPSP